MGNFYSKVLVLLLLLIPCAYADQEVGIIPLKLGIISSNVTATSSAAVVPTTAFAGRRSISICNNSASTVTAYIGNSSVTSSNGLPLSSSNPCVSLDVNSSVVIYAITASSTADLRILEAR